jgi:SAM-dependent methyltransferase
VAGGGGGRGNDTFLLDAIAQLAAAGPEEDRAPRVLDFGCGEGTLVARGRAIGHDILGADRWEAGWEDLRRRAPEAVRDHLHAIGPDGRLPFAAGRFDMVVSNQVFEHIAEPRAALAEVARVLRPGGTFLAIFNLRETWYEGHVGLHFVHLLVGRPRLLRACLRLCRTLGLGLPPRGEGETPAAWAERMARSLETECCYHRGREVRRLWREAFGEAPRSLAEEYVASRLRGTAAERLLPGALRAPAFRAIAHVRVGAVLLVRRSPDR